jgi:hypothetical protein
LPNSRTFSGVTTDVLLGMKQYSRDEYKVVYDPPEGAISTATSQTPLGECVIKFVHDSAKAELTLTLVKKPWLLPEGVLWRGFVATLERFRKEA